MNAKVKVSDLEENINTAIRDFTDVISLSLVYDESSSYDMQLILRNPSNKSIRIICHDVSGLQIEKFGGGLTKMGGLRAYDVSDRQLDRIKIRFFDRSSETTFFECAKVGIQEIGPIAIS